MLNNMKQKHGVKDAVGIRQRLADVEWKDVFFFGRARRATKPDVFPLPSIDRSFLRVIGTTAPPYLKVRVSAIGLLQLHQCRLIFKLMVSALPYKRTGQ